MSNPALPAELRASLVRQLMNAKRGVATARRANDIDTEAAAREAVNDAKHALGERGPVWWSDGAPDLNRHMARNTVYADWFAALD